MNEATTAVDRKLDELIMQLEKRIAKCSIEQGTIAWKIELALLQTIKTDREAMNACLEYMETCHPGDHRKQCALPLTRTALDSSNKTIESI